MSYLDSKIVVINQTSGYLMQDIVTAFAEQYEEVVLLASWPLKGVETDRIIAFDRRSSARKLWTWIVATVQIWWRVVRKYRDDELFIVSNPPSAPLLPLLFRNRFSLLIFDIYPDVLVNQRKLNKNHFVIRWWQNANQKVYLKAKHVFTISEGMKDCLCQYVEADKIKVMPLWPNNAQIHKIEKSENPFIKEHDLEGKFIVLYSGNLGSTHRVEVLIDVAQKVKDAIFLIVGQGAKMELIVERIKKEHCENVIQLPRQPMERLSEVLSAADIAVVTLDTSASQMSVPSKTFNLMAVGVPLMCIASPESELGRLVRKSEMGRVFLPDDIDGMASFVNEMKDDCVLKKRLGQNALDASKHYTSENARLLVHNA